MKKLSPKDRETLVRWEADNLYDWLQNDSNELLKVCLRGLTGVEQYSDEELLSSYMNSGPDTQSALIPLPNYFSNEELYGDLLFMEGGDTE